jgi:hypothetical protein
VQYLTTLQVAKQLVQQNAPDNLLAMSGHEYTPLSTQVLLEPQPS